MSTAFKKIKVSDLHNNLDASKAIEQRIEPVWSVWPCDFCKVIKRNRRAKPDELNRVYSMMNEVFCPFNFVKIGNKIYHRRRKFFYGIDDFDDKEAIKEKNRCHDCGVQAGFIHHVGCDCDECPKCGGQFIFCDCSITHRIKFLIEEDFVEE